jgi:hypothetical protein
MDETAVLSALKELHQEVELDAGKDPARRQLDLPGSDN